MHVASAQPRILEMLGIGRIHCSGSASASSAEQARASGQAEEIVEKMAKGRLRKVL